MLHRHYPASVLIRTHPPPSRLRPTSRGHRLYGLPCSVNFLAGRGGLLQLLGMSLPPCRRFHPAEVVEPHQSDFGSSCCLHPTDVGSAFGFHHFRGHIAFTVVTARRLVISPREILSIGFRILVSRDPAIQTTGLLTFTPAGLTPADHASLTWTHNRA